NGPEERLDVLRDGGLRCNPEPPVRARSRTGRAVHRLGPGRWTRAQLSLAEGRLSGQRLHHGARATASDRGPRSHDAGAAQGRDTRARGVVVRSLSGPRRRERSRAARARLHGAARSGTGPARGPPHDPARERRGPRRRGQLSAAGALRRAHLAGSAAPFDPTGILALLGKPFLNRAKKERVFPRWSASEIENHPRKSNV